MRERTGSILLRMSAYSDKTLAEIARRQAAISCSPEAKKVLLELAERLQKPGRKENG